MRQSTERAPGLASRARPARGRLGGAALVLVLVLGTLTARPAAADPPPAPRSPGTNLDPGHLAGGPPPRAAVQAQIAREAPAAKVTWNPAWAKFRGVEYTATLGLGALAFGSLLIPPSPTRWNGINGFDRAARDALRLESETGRHFARDTSDVLLTLLINQLLVDSLVVAWWGYDRRDVAAQMMLMDMEAFAFTGAVNAITAAVASRERPYRENCTGPEETQPNDCTSSKRYRSFFSGHTSSSFTAASLTCIHHAHLPLYGGGAAEVAACAVAYGSAATVGAMRVLADQHFVTDVIAGAAVGTLSGLAIPYFLHYAGGRRPAPAGRERASAPPLRVRLVPAPLGAAAVGEFW